jgi:DNA-binding CsgD family transcriptional regulator
MLIRQRSNRRDPMSRRARTTTLRRRATERRVVTALDARFPGLWPITGRREAIEQAREALLHPDVLGVVVRGDMGTGKSRLAAEVAANLEADGTPVMRVAANATLRGVPLGALVPLLPDDASAGGAETPDGMRALAGALTTRLAPSDGPRALVVIDDVHELDPTSAAVVAQALASDRVAILASARTGAAVPDVLMAHWRSGRAVAIELPPLTRSSCDTLLHRVCGGPVDGRAAQELWQLSAGNPLFLRELVLGSVAAGVFVEQHGVWSLTGEIEPSPMLRDVVLARMHGEGDATREALELLCLTDAIGLADLERDAGAATVEALELAGWIRIEPDQRRLLVRLAHPLYGDIVRDGMSRRRRRTVALALIEGVERHGARRRTDPLRLAQWRLDAEGQAPAAELIAGARTARNEHDHARVEQLARAALAGTATDDERVIAGQLLGDALHAQGGFAEAEVVLRAADERATEVDRQLEIAVQRATNLFWGIGDIDAARALIEHARAAQSEANAAQLQAHLAMMELYAGDPRPAAALADADDHGNPVVRAAYDSVAAVALAMQGRVDTAIAVTERGAAAHARVGDLLATAHPGIHVVNRVLALTHAGRFDEAEATARAGWDFSVAERQVVGQIWFAAQLGEIAMRRGQVATARRWFEQQALCCSDGGQRLQAELAYIGIGLAAGAQRDAEGTDVAADAYDATHLEWFGLFEGQAARAAAWRAVAHHRPRDASTVLARAAGEAAGRGIVVDEVGLLHDQARLGDAATVAARLAELADGAETPVFAAHARHAAALGARDRAALIDVAATYEGLGLLLDAAETLSEAAQLATADGDQRAATQLRNRVDELTPALEGADTPGLLRTDAVVPLSSREREIADLAAAGVQSKEIAAALFISVRTVNNHLQKIYAKLGVRSRAELRAVLDAGVRSDR